MYPEFFIYYHIIISVSYVSENEEVMDFVDGLVSCRVVKRVLRSDKDKGGRPTLAEGSQNISKENKALYCVCNKIESGKMVACDNISCEIKWFHFDCVGLKRAPRNKWFCEDCPVQPKN